MNRYEFENLIQIIWMVNFHLVKEKNLNLIWKRMKMQNYCLLRLKTH